MESGFFFETGGASDRKIISHRPNHEAYRKLCRDLRRVNPKKMEIRSTEEIVRAFGIVGEQLGRLIANTPVDECGSVDIIKASELSELLGVSRSTLHRLIDRAGIREQLPKISRNGKIRGFLPDHVKLLKKLHTEGSSNGEHLTNRKAVSRLRPR